MKAAASVWRSAATISREPRALRRLPAVWRELVDDDAGGRGAGRQRGRGAAQFGQVAAVDRECADGADPALVDVKVASVRAQPGVDRADPAGLVYRDAAQQGQRAAVADLEAGDRAG